MSAPPEYFEGIRESASRRWDQLEHDPELAGPWHQLFKQVQSPRHILSELLQNADDAGADFASVKIENGIFIFRHNGGDFTKEHFLSLCRFGYSNKRALHTIGFRGIGFKSIFSLGDRVELYSPTLSIAFDKQRFTEPKWLDAPLRNDDGLTEVRVKIKDEQRKFEIEKNLLEWIDSPVSLLFFKNIRHIQIKNEEIKWRIIGPGPVEDTKLVGIVDNNEKSYLVVKSQFEEFPLDALAEIRDERMFNLDDGAEYPPCQVEIVVGANGRLFVVLPTGVKTSLPFACNAPFIQDPARLKIKDPEISPTNRWLLGRIGKLAALVFLQWLRKEALGIENRSMSYELLPEVESDDNSLEEMCGAIVVENFNSIIENQKYLLTEEGDLKPVNQSVIIPDEIIEIWPAKQDVSLLDDLSRPALSHHISKTNKSKLLHREVVEEITKEKIMDVLRNKHMPRPENWHQLLNLWIYVASEFSRRIYFQKKDICIIPVQGKNVLYSASEVVRLGENKILQSDEDWNFLLKYLLVSNNDWFRFLSDKKRNAEEDLDKLFKEKIESVYDVLQTIGLDRYSDASRVIEQVADEFFRFDEITISDCVQLTQIVAKLRAKIGDSFKYYTEDKCLRPINDNVLFDENGRLEQILPTYWSINHLLHSDYYKEFKFCTRDEWIAWINSGSSGINTFVPFIQKESRILGRPEIKHEVTIRGFNGEPEFQYMTNYFIIVDWDFDDILWKHWQSSAENDNNFWGHLVEHILIQAESFWSKATDVRALQSSSANSRNKKTIIRNCSLLPGWVLKLRELSCLPDTRGTYRKPSEIFRRTPKTESLWELEPFIDFRYDNQSTRGLLILLNVCDTPIGPDRLLDRLRALSKADYPPLNEVDKWYQRLDQMLYSCSTDDFTKIKKVFNDEKIILAESGYWGTLSEVFLFADEEDVPGAEIIRSSVKELIIWRKIGVNERPTADLVIHWLKDLPSGQLLSQDDLRRVRSILPRHPVRIWNECGHWLNLAGEWIKVENIKYSITMQSLIPWKHLHEGVKQKTADFQRLSEEFMQKSPFADISILANKIENRFHQEPSFISSPKRREWLNRFGKDICRIELDDKDNTSRIRSLAINLADTLWQKTPGLETIPYIDGIPAGTPTNVDVMWLNRTLYFNDIPNAKLASKVPDNLGKMFNHLDITAALNYCYGRTPQEVTEYLEENFTLQSPEEVKPHDITPISQDEPEEAKTQDITLIPQQEEPEKGSDTPKTLIVPEDDKVEPNDEKPDGTEGIGGTKTKEVHAPKPTKPSIMERFALIQGYHKEDENNFFHSNGNRIRKSNKENIFPWEKLSSAGEVICYYLPKNQCLQYEPLEIEADVWGMIDKYPDTCAFILSDIEDKPIELSGKHIRSMLEEKKINLYPATYRIVYKNDTELLARAEVPR